MRVAVVDAAEGWPPVEALDREAYSSEVMASVPWRIGIWNGTSALGAGIGRAMTSLRDR